MMIAPGRFVLALLVLGLAVPAQKKSLSLEQGLGLAGPRLRYYTPPRSVRWAPDGVHYVWREKGKTFLVDPATGTKRPAPASLGARLKPHGLRGGPLRRGRSDPRLRLRQNDIYLRLPGTEEKRLTKDGAAKRLATLSPDHRWASFVRGQDLNVVRVADGKEWAISTDGSKELLYGVLDWVYQEEVYGRYNFRGHWWRKDGEALAFLAIDEAPVKDFTVINHVPNGFLDRERSVIAEVTNYPKAGDPNPKVQLAVAWPKTQQIVRIDLARYEPDILVVRVGWTPDQSKLLFMVQDRIQTWLDLDTADPKTGKVSRILREQSKAWVNRLAFPLWQPDGSFLWLSERTGYRHIYEYDANGKLERAVTSGEWQVRRIVDQDQKHIWFTATKDGAINDNLYRVDRDARHLMRLTRGEGRHRVSFDAAHTWFLDTVSSFENPGEVRLCKGDGSATKVLDTARPKDIQSWVYCPKHSLTIQARDGYPLDATLIKPPDFDPNARYPIYLPTYSGPDAPSVRNAFGASKWQQLLAQKGCLVLQVNVRSASGRGQVHTETAYKHLGVGELRDLEDAVAFVCAHHGGDAKRVCIDGWSYGGFMAAYALTHSTSFSLGIAGGGVHDWRLYDTIYTERYMSTPQLNKKGYDESSVIKAAKNLHGHLVLLHGTMDDNVHMQNTIQLIYALQRAGKQDFELMLYPRSRHGVRSPHLRRFVWRAIRDHLGLQ